VGDVNDWHHAVGTGPYILKDFVSGASATLVKNPGYWGFDDRYPQNQLPYIDTIKYLVITDNSTALSAMRTGKLDCIELLALTDAQAIQKSNPELVQFTNVMSACETLEPRNDLKPIVISECAKRCNGARSNSIAKNYFLGTADPIRNHWLPAS